MASSSGSRNDRENEHKFAMDDLQDAVDQTMTAGDARRLRNNLRRARDREQAAREALRHGEAQDA